MLKQETNFHTRISQGMETSLPGSEQLCETCSSLDIRSLFQFGLQGPPLRPWQSPGARPGALYLGNLSQIGGKSSCPFCCLICHCALQEYGDFITPELLMKLSGEEISCHLETFPADWNKSDLGETADAGPAAWYIGFLFANLRVQANTWARYLVLDFQDAALVDNDWTSVYNTPDSLVRDEEKPFLDVMYSFDRKGRPNLKGKPKIYIYSGRDLGEGSVDINVVLSWITF